MDRKFQLSRLPCGIDLTSFALLMGHLFALLCLRVPGNRKQGPQASATCQ